MVPHQLAVLASEKRIDQEEEYRGEFAEGAWVELYKFLVPCLEIHSFLHRDDVGRCVHVAVFHHLLMMSQVRPEGKKEQLESCQPSKEPER